MKNLIALIGIAIMAVAGCGSGIRHLHAGRPARTNAILAGEIETKPPRTNKLPESRRGCVVLGKVGSAARHTGGIIGWAVARGIRCRA